MTKEKEMMNAIVVKEFGGPDNLHYSQIEIPKTRAKQIKIKINAIGVNPNESYVLTGNYNLYQPELPFIPGFDAAGTVIEVGSDATKYKVGDRVFVGSFKKLEQSGTYAEQMVVDEDIAIPLPENVSFEEGASLGIPAFTAYHVLFQRAKISENETIFIHGATGGVGTLAVQMAKAAGLTVIGSSSNEAGRKAILENGADYAIPHLSDDTLDQLLSITNNEGPDVIVEFLANKNLENDLKTIKTKGRIIVVGARDSIEISPRLILSRNIDILGASLPNLTEKEYEEAKEGILKLLSSNQLKPIIGEQLDLKDAESVLDTITSRSGRGKSILIP
ncbi:NADPH:quinone reductase [Aerococcaceae bacterium WGS1372]